MTNSGRGQWLARTAFAAAAALAGGNAGAVVYSSTFDPPNFSGTATFDVSQSCLDMNPGPGPALQVGNDGDSCTVTWLTATVTFQDAPGLTFNYSHLLPDSGIVSSIWVQGGELVGVESGLLGPRISGSSDTSHTPFHGPWWIQYRFAPPSDLSEFGPPSSGDFGLGVVYLYTGECTEGCAPFSDPEETAHVETFTRVTPVPEPGSLALLLAALASACCARRRPHA